MPKKTKLSDKGYPLIGHRPWITAHSSSNRINAIKMRQRRGEVQNNNTQNIELTIKKGGGDVKAQRSEWDIHEWEIILEGRNMNKEQKQTAITIDIKEGVGEITRWITNEDMEKIKIPLYREMGGEFSRIQQTMWYKQAIKDLIRTGVQLEIVIRDNEEKLWAQDQIWGLDPEN